MSIKNIVSSQLPEITTYDSTGNITGIVVEAVTANTVSSAGNLIATGNVNGSGMTITGNAIITGNANVQGTLTFNDTTNITTSNLVLGLGNNQSGINVTGAGIVVGSTAEAQFLYNEPAQTWDSNIGIDSAGNITAPYFIGNGSLLTGLPASYGDSNVTTLLSDGTVTSNVVTTGNISGNYMLGNGSLLTGLAASGNSITNGTSNVRIAAANGNITMSVANVANVVTVTADSLRVAGNIFDINGQVYGVPASFAKYRRTTAQTGIVDGSAVICNVSEDTFGTDIEVNTTTGNITLQPGKTYRLRGSPGSAARTSGAAGTPSAIRYQWFNVTGGALMGTDAYIVAPNSDNPTAFYAGTAEVVFTPSVTTVVQFRITDAFQANAIGNGGGVFPWIDVQVIGGGAPIVNAAQFGSITDPAFFVRKSTTSTALVDVTNSTFTLPAGTWLVSYSLCSFNTSNFSGTTLVIADAANNIVPDSRTTVNATSAEIPMAKSVIITVSSPTQYKLRFATTNGGTSNLENEANKAELIWTQIAGLAPYAGIPNWISAGTIQAVGIGATTTAPTVPTGAAKNNISYKQLGAKTWEVTGVFEVTTGASGAVAGSGDYLFTLPAGLQFDTTLPFQAPYQLNVATNSNLLISRTIPGSTGFSTDFTAFTNTFPSGPVIWDATRYRILFTTGSVFQCWGSGGAGWFAMSNNARMVYWTFTFQST